MASVLLANPSPNTSGTIASASGSASAWRVDVINGPRPVIVEIVTDTSAWSWSIAADEHRTLLDESAPHAGGIEVVGQVNGDGCFLLDSANFDAQSFTLVLSGSVQGTDYHAMVVPGASLTGPADAKYTTDCSG